MRTATVADLRNHFKKISAWLDNGEMVEITKRGKGYAVIQLRQKVIKKKIVMPDFAAQRQRIWGDRPPLTAAEVKEMRDWEDGEFE